ncbi:MAG: hypothetical protein M3Z66_22395 [Chloroflexota bacterium]|nr:hypothetical protein [Chloroflexota bacterium]
MRFLPFLCMAVAISGCASSAAPKATAVPVVSYHDQQYRFSFSYPSGWKAPTKGGHVTSVQSVPTYVVPVTTPHNIAGVQVTVDHQVIPLPTFVEGRVAADPSGGPDTFHYHHLKVSGWPAMQIKRYSGTTVDGVFTIINTRTLSYQVEMITAQPPFPPTAFNGYNTIVRTLKIPFS